MRVLVVEDHVALAEAFAESIRRSGHLAYVASTGATAMTLARAHEPHAVLLDLGLPDIDGYELARAMRDQGLSKATVIIVVTGKLVDQDSASGVDLVLQKPVEGELLAGLIEYLSRRRRAALRS
ncbi:MAG TPA: response regulator [Kofleriaceae bacterium]|jgi:DNA-binding response OmpR family regulator|nr:response regulator [Kofleriaceae bacterium]